MMINAPDIEVNRIGHSGHIMLNRPKALNALSGEMCRQISEVLMGWADDDQVHHVLITGAPGKAFCAGGDVRALVPVLKTNHDEACRYFESEYRLDLIINTFPKPIITLADGLTMGGGSGVLLNARFQVITERMDFAMPETAIGLFPDVAASIFLRRAPKSVGAFLGITGWRIGAGDMIALGILDQARGVVVNSQEMDALTETLTALEDGDDETISEAIWAVMQNAQITPEDHPIFDAQDWIDDHFSKPTIAAIRASLDGDDHPMADACRKAMDRRSPLSMAVTHHLLTAPEFAALTVPAALALDYTLACRITLKPDFIEGVRAVLIDKDNAPKWQPSSIADVTPLMVEELFAEEGRLELHYPDGYNHSIALKP